MKKFTLFVTLLALAACVSGTTFEVKNETPLETLDSFEEVDGSLTATPSEFSKGIDTKNGQRLFSVRRNSDGVPNSIISRTLTVTFSPSERITLVQVVTELPGFVSIVGGGIGSNYVSVRVQSQVNTGYDFTVLINY